MKYELKFPFVLFHFSVFLLLGFHLQESIESYLIYMFIFRTINVHKVNKFDCSSNEECWDSVGAQLTQLEQESVGAQGVNQTLHHLHLFAALQPLVLQSVSLLQKLSQVGDPPTIFLRHPWF